MKRVFLSLLIIISALRNVTAENMVVSGPDGQLQFNLFLENGSLYYRIIYKQQEMLESSPLGLVTSVSDFSKELTYIEKKEQTIHETYYEPKIKKSKVDYNANELKVTFQNLKSEKFSVVIRVSNNDVAFKYVLEQNSAIANCVIEKELTGFTFPKGTTTFLTPQAPPVSGWKRTKPSYEEDYVPDESIGTPSQYGVGYTFPSLFRIGGNGWVLVSETGVTSLYCGSKLSEGTSDGQYSIAFPLEGENNGMGSGKPCISLPGETPWRTLTVSDNLKPVVETTVAFDVVKALYKPTVDYRYGRSTWSWLLWQDASINYNDQKTFIDLSSGLGYEYVLVDASWDKQIGRAKMEELASYAKSKNVALFLWYNSNGLWNDAPQTPKHCMNTSWARKQEMAWLKSIGVKGIKVDFFGGDKQETMKLYEDILTEANEYGLMVIFHGCTLPRGWERMYPNFVGAEAVLASENLFFWQKSDDKEAFSATLHPFIRNAVGAMDFGPVLLNKRHDKTNEKGRIRRTTETFQLATSVLFQSPVQNFGITPNNLTEYPAFVVDFMKNIPTTWDESVFIDGYPGRYCVLARRHGNQWYVAGINAEKEVKQIKVNLPMFAGKRVMLYCDNKEREPQLKDVNISSNGDINVDIQPEGAFIITK